MCDEKIRRTSNLRQGIKIMSKIKNTFNGILPTRVGYWRHQIPVILPSNAATSPILEAGKRRSLRRMISSRGYLVFLAMTLLACGECPAAIILTFMGLSGSPHMTVTGSGSITSTGSAGGGSNSSFLLVPDATPEWTQVRNNVGDYLASTWSSVGSEGRELPLTGNLQVMGSGSAEFGFTFEHLRLDDDVSPGGDDLDLRFSSAQPYPEYPAGITVSLAGTSTFTLQDGNTFDDLIPGTYRITGLGDAGNDSIDYVIRQTIPEPSSVLLLAVVTASWSLRRRRRPM